jgi:NADH-quinone oxidoreductase subunit J
MTPNALDLALLLLLLAATLWAVLTAELLRSAIALAAASVVLTLLLFRMHAPLAAMFELSVCAGLITVVFVSAISLTKPVAEAEARELRGKRWRRYVWLPLLLIAAGCWLCFRAKIHLTLPALPSGVQDVREVLWRLRRFDLLGQILVILAGVFGVVVLFKVRRNAAGEEE